MTDDMERLIGAALPGDVAGLDGVEDAVWSRVSARRKGTSVSRVRIAAVAFALMIGATNGGLMLLTPQPEPSEMQIFTVSVGLAPLASLEVRG
jgi:hypothetical protein